MPVDTKAATDRLMRFLAVEGVTGQEAAIGRELTAALKESGVPAKAIRLDDANTRIPVPTETGNLIVDLPGRGALHNQPRIMFMTHMDTVPLCAGARPKKSGRKIVNEAKTALGGDNRCGCGVLVTLAAELEKQKLDHPPITLLFCVREESGLYGARHVKLDELGSPVMAFNYDGGSASNVVIGAVGADRWNVEIFHDMRAGIAGCDVVMMLRLQLERMDGVMAPSQREYFRFFGLDREKLAFAAPHVKVMHPGPMNRGVEIDSEVADDLTVSLIQDQVEMGVAARMAVLTSLAARLDNDR